MKQYTNQLRNIEGVTVMPVNNINVYDLLKYPKL